MIKNRCSKSSKELSKERIAIDVYRTLGVFDVKSGRRLEK